MADKMDRVQAVNEWWQEECLAEHRRQRTGHSGQITEPSLISAYCVDCGEEIPAARIRAVPGCTRCIDCQTEFERRNR